MNEIGVLVYTFRGKTYAALLGGSSPLKTKADVFKTGQVNEIFEVSRPEGTPLLSLIRDLIVEVDKRGMKDEDIVFTRDLLQPSVRLLAREMEKSSSSH